MQQASLLDVIDYATDEERDTSRPFGRCYFLWMPKHDEIIIAAIAKGTPVPELAKVFGITRGAMRRRIFVMRQQGKLGYISAPGSRGRYERVRA